MTARQRSSGVARFDMMNEIKFGRVNARSLGNRRLSCSLKNKQKIKRNERKREKNEREREKKEKYLPFITGEINQSGISIHGVLPGQVMSLAVEPSELNEVIGMAEITGQH